MSFGSIAKYRRSIFEYQDGLYRATFPVRRIRSMNINKGDLVQVLARPAPVLD